MRLHANLDWAEIARIMIGVGSALAAHWKFPLQTACTDIESAVGKEIRYLDANALAVHVMGDALYANPILLGYAFQRGWIPLHMDSLLRASRGLSASSRCAEVSKA